MSKWNKSSESRCKITTALCVILIDAHFILLSTFTHITCQAAGCMHMRVRIVLCLYNLLVQSYVIRVINKLLFINQYCKCSVGVFLQTTLLDVYRRQYIYLLFVQYAKLLLHSLYI